MMRKNPLSLAMLLVAAPLAQAHPELHDDLGPWQNLAHHLTEPDHLAAILLAGLAGYLFHRFLQKRRENR